MHVEGHVEPGWGAVADAFRANLERDDLGAAVSVYLDGRAVVDLWGGLADGTTGRPWERDTIVPVFSTTKGVTATVANLLVERGVLDPDATVATYWPEFAANGKDGVLLRHALSHSVGLPVVEGDFTLEQALAWDPVVEQLASQRPIWEPGTKCGYHFRTYGWMIGEVVRRATGTTLGQVFAREVAAPLGLDFWIGLPEELEPRVARLVPPAPPEGPEIAALFEAAFAPGTLLGDALRGPSALFAYDEMWNTRALHACELPSSNGIGSARAVARMYAATVGEVDGTRLVSAETVARATAVACEGRDRVIGFPMRYGLGYALGPSLPPSCGPGAFGHGGAGGSLGFADHETGVGFGYAMNLMRFGLDEADRGDRLVHAVGTALGV